MNTTTVGIFATHSSADVALSELLAFGIASEDISYVYVNAQGDLVDDQSGEKVGQGAVTGASTGAIIGVVLGIAVAEGVLPGLGGLIVGGSLATALGFSGAAATAVAGAVTGAAAGGLIGALSGLGVSDDDAARFQEYVRIGDVLIIVRSATVGVGEVMLHAKAREVQNYRVA